MFDWAVGTGGPDRAAVPPGGGYQLALIDVNGGRNATSPVFSISAPQPTVRILSIFEGTCVERKSYCLEL